MSPTNLASYFIATTMDLIDLLFFFIGKGLQEAVNLLGFKFPKLSDGGFVVLGLIILVFLIFAVFQIGKM